MRAKPGPDSARHSVSAFRSVACPVCGPIHSTDTPEERHCGPGDEQVGGWKKVEHRLAVGRSACNKIQGALWEAG